MIPGDGIGKEVVPEGLKVLAAALEGTGVGVATTDFHIVYGFFQSRNFRPDRKDTPRYAGKTQTRQI